MPTFFRNLRRVALKTSSFMVASGLRFDHTLVTAWHEPLSFEARKRSSWPGMTKTLRVVRMVQHVFAEIALAAGGARGGVGGEHVAVPAAGDIFAGADRDLIGAATRGGVAPLVNHGRLC